MRDRRKKKKQALAGGILGGDEKSAAAAAVKKSVPAATTMPSPKKDDAGDHVTRGTTKESGAADAEEERTTTRNRSSHTRDTARTLSSSKRLHPEYREDDVGSSQAEATGGDGTVHRITVPDTLSPKEAKKFRKDERRKSRQQGYQVEFLDTATTANAADPSPENGNNKDKTHQPPTKKRKLRPDAFPRINDLVRQAQEDRERDEKRKAAANDEEELTDLEKGRYVALDCEMVGIGTDGKKSALARVSLVDWYGQVLLDTFVQVPDRVVDFRTQYSGVRPKDIKGNHHALKPDDVRQQVAALVKDRILVGHALHNDLSVLMLQHPKSDIRDTAKFRPFQRFHLKWRPRKLRDLVKERLGKVIQDGSHDSTVDAASTMELFRLVRKEWEQELAHKKSRKR